MMTANPVQYQNITVKISPHITKVKELKGYNGKAPRIRTSLEFERKNNNTKNEKRSTHRV